VTKIIRSQNRCVDRETNSITETKIMIKANLEIDRRKFIGSAVAGAVIAGLPHIASAQAKVIKVGMPTILSGRVAILGTSSRAAVQLAFSQINAAGGVNGRKFELIDRDTKGRPDEAAKVRNHY
jgi:branched-chain amino acid transport system substrate-binding protein